MSAFGFIVIPLGDTDVTRDELRDLARDLQERIAEVVPLTPLMPIATHWVDDSRTASTLAFRLKTDGHGFPDCKACP